ncbi:MAG: carbon-nitrogen hydrolase family protein [Anaerolineae bacterium]|nr:carbon-nitrogen hydrolase family protein [Anaerolineae bacterium]
MQRFTAACAQYAVAPMDVEENLRRAVEWVRRAFDESGAQLIVLPETATTGFTPNVGPEGLWDTVSELPGAHSEPLQRVCQELGVFLCYGAYERAPGEPRGTVYNSAALLGPNGDVLGVYRKTHLFPTERRANDGWSTPGTQPCVVHTPLASIGMTICYDGDFPELFRAEALLGAEVILRPSALLRSFEIWELTNRARAYDNHVYMVACNAVGPDAGNNYYFGHSMIVDPISRKLAQGRGTEEVIFAELDPDPIKRITYGSASPMIFDHLRDRNLEAYRGILQPGRSRFEPAK